MKKTSLGLKKPEGTDLVNIQDMNDNMDVIEKELQARVKTTGDIKDTTVTFTQASSRANIVTGEKMAVIMGKIKKFFADLTAPAFAQMITTKADLMATKATGYVPDAKAVADAVSEVTGKLTWKRIGSTSVTGTGSVTIPTGASELIIKANLGYNIIIDILIPVAFLGSTEQSYRGGYYQNGSNGGMADFKCTSSKVTFNSAFLNANSVTTTAEWVVYYR